MQTTPATKNCLACGKPVRGRSDKKFCDDYCRNVFNNQRKTTEESPAMKLVNSILRKNRSLLEKQVPEGEEMGKCPRKKMADAGFNFLYHTHQYTNKKGNVYWFVYEYGYLPLEGDWLLVVKRKDLEA